VDGYDAAGNVVANAKDMIALYVHNLGLNFHYVGPSFSDPTILNVGCGLFRLTPGQMNTPMQMAFQATVPSVRCLGWRSPCWRRVTGRGGAGAGDGGAAGTTGDGNSWAGGPLGKVNSKRRGVRTESGATRREWAGVPGLAEGPSWGGTGSEVRST
jgi:hypothetical protein